MSLSWDTSFSAFFKKLDMRQWRVKYARLKRREGRLADGIKVASALERGHEVFYRGGRFWLIRRAHDTSSTGLVKAPGGHSLFGSTNDGSRGTPQLHKLEY